MFKSYTRRSSALVGASRAGLSADAVIQQDGKWGFITNETAANDETKAAVVIANGLDMRVPNSAKTKAPLFTGLTQKQDRRKLLRIVNRGLKSVQQSNKQPGAKMDVSWLRDSARRLRQSYRAADIPRFLEA